LVLLPGVTDTASMPFGADDVLLVTGGGKGIAAECALALGRRTGVKLALLGRAQPERDAELTANLERFTAAGTQWRYYSVDVEDAAAVKNAVERAGHELGEVTAVLHGAGNNVPQLLSRLDEAAFNRALAPKVQGLRNILSAVDADSLRLCVTFGSIIARAGLVGEADYALANEWQTAVLEDFQAAHPQCRCLALEWSVWSGVGMGERLGRVESLVQQGITPITVDQGVEILCQLVSAERQPSVAVVVAGRFGEPPTLLIEKPELPFLRFLEKPRAFYPGIELIADATLSSANDPYLEDHVYHGERLFPAVLGLEAMAQAAMAVSGIPAPPCFENVSFDRPIVVPREGELTIRIAALVRGPGLVEVVMRSAETGFAADHFKALCRFDPRKAEEPPEQLDTSTVPGFVAAPLPLDMGAEIYDELLFHTGRFRRVAGYRHLRAKECLAEIEPDTMAQWFGRYLPANLVLGDAGARDGAIHCIQACIPHRRLLPIGIGHIELGGAPCMKKMREAMQAGPTKFLLRARERRQEGDILTYDLELLSCDGCVLERWTGLRLRAVEDLKRTTPWPAALLSPWVERKAGELAGSGLSVMLTIANENSDAVRTDAAIQLAADSPWPVRRRPDGKPEMAGRSVSASHAGGLTLAVTGQGTVGCDLEPVAARTATVWQDLLGAERFDLAGLIASEAREDFDAAATRVWAAGECLKKAGAMGDAPLVLDASKPDGWVVLLSGHWSIATCVPPVGGFDGAVPMAVAVLTAKGK
jgi:enediyne polyketide synthase